MTFDFLALKQGELEKIFLGLGFFLALNFALWSLKVFLVRKLVKNHSSYSDALKLLTRPLNLVIVTISFAVSLPLIPDRLNLHPLLNYGSKVLIIFAALWIVDRSIKLFLTRPKALGIANEASRSLLLQISRLLILAIGSLIVLDTVGISITPLLASLGVSSLAVALALQDTLSNFFAGVYLLVDQPIRLGEYVKGPDGAEGIVRKIGWRSTRIENGSGHTVIIPNSKLSSASITNFDIPSSDVNLPITFTVSFLSDVDLVEQITREVLSRTVSNQPACLKNITPSFVFSNVRDLGIDVQVTLRIRNITEAGAVKNFFFKNLIKDFKSAHILFAHIETRSTEQRPL